MEPKAPPFQFSLKWLMVQTGLACFALLLLLDLPRRGALSSALLVAAELAALCAATGAMIGGWYGEFRLGAAIGLLFCPFIMLLAPELFGIET